MNTSKPSSTASTAKAKEDEATYSNNIDYVSEIDLMKFDITNDFMTCEKTLWHDGDHWSAKGETLFAPRLDFLLD